jgi:hypothetical protein
MIVIVIAISFHYFLFAVRCAAVQKLGQIMMMMMMM